MIRSIRFLPALAGLLLALPTWAQDLPTLTEDDYAQWETMRGASLSPDGRWMAVNIARVDDDGELRIHRTDTDSVVVVAHATRPTFSDDGRWLAYSIGVSEEAREAAQKAKKPVRNKLGLMNLVTGEATEREDIASFAFSGDSRYVALRRYKPQGQESDGVDVIVHELVSGEEMSFGNISEMAWQDDGALLAMITSAADQVGNGVRIYDAATGRIQGLDTDEADYSQLSWREDAADLVVYKAVTDEAFQDTAHAAMVWRGLDSGTPRAMALDPAEDEGFPEGMRIVEFRAPRFSEDGRTLFVGIQERQPAPEECEADAGGGEGAEEGGQDAADEDDEACQEEEEDEENPGVEIWHTRDVDPVPQQRVRERQLRQENHITAWHMDRGTVVQLGNELTESVSLSDDGTRAIGRDETPYDEDAMFRQQFFDLYEVDVATGARTLVEDRITGFSMMSPDGRYALWFEGEDWFARDLERDVTRNLTEGLDGVFVDLDVTPTREQMPAFGTGGWMEDGSAVFLNTEYDVWMVRTDGSGGERITDGAVQEIRYRLTGIDRDDDPGFDRNEPLYFSLAGEWTKKSGYARARRAGAAPETLIFEDARIFGLQKAEEADRFAFRRERFDDSPDMFVAGAMLSDARQVTETNPFNGEYAWGRTELIEYENEWGRRLQGVLTYPANYDPSKQYPMILYQYEILSTGLHQYQVPDPTNYYNQQIWSQNGYFVLRPDIVYRDRRPGQSNVETLRPAVAAALEAAPIDGDRLGLIGHSWGGYQTTYFVTQDDLFAAAVAGAPLTNLMSMYLSFYWNSGGTDARIFEISQGRMQVPWWEDWDSYYANSPVHHIQNMETPLLMMFGTNDGAVEYNQGVEFYNAARRLGKQMVLLNYDGENHGLREEANQKDYQQRIMQWFGHYLKGEPAPEWMTEGMPYVEQKDEIMGGGN